MSTRSRPSLRLIHSTEQPADGPATRSRPSLKSLPGTVSGPRAVDNGAFAPAVGEPKGVARKGVPSALRSDPHAVTVTGIMPGFQVRTTGVPMADWLCSCGHHERARGAAAVLELTERVRVGVCPHRSVSLQERRTFA
ncbi:hypothetical protein SUDANB70_02816 [Streptomyces sp. enrichment culture]